MTKHNFQQTRRGKGITAQAVAEAAGVSLRVEYTFEIGGFVPLATREQIVAAFSTLAGQSYRLDEFEDPKIAMPPAPVPLFTRRKERAHAATTPLTTRP